MQYANEATEMEKADFKLEVEITLAPIWVNLPDLMWHFLNEMHYAES